MAEVYRPTYTTTDPATGKKQKRKSKTWHIRYYLPSGERRRVKGYRDKRATETKAAELERRAAREAEGIFDPLDLHAKRPLSEHLTDYIRYMNAKGNTATHIDITETRIRACLDGCRFVKLTDVQPSAVIEFLARLRQDANDKPGKSITTANYYMVALKGFTRWLWKDKRAAVDPLAGMSKLANAAADVRRVRRDLSPDEMTSLATAAHGADPFRGLAGADRRILYLTAAGTGFRLSELVALRPDDFNLDGNPATATVRAAYTKNGQTAVQPLPADLADVLRPFLARKPRGEAVWPGTWRERAAKMFYRDLAAARRTWLSAAQNARQRAEREKSDFLAECDAAGRVVDFHALRHTYISRIVQSGASAKTAQTLARHSTVQLTLGRYAHATLMDLSAAVEALPPIGHVGPRTEAAALRATGTDNISPKNLGPNLGPDTASECDFLRLAETEGEVSAQQKTPGKHGISAVSQGKSRMDRAGLEPATSGFSVRGPDAATPTEAAGCGKPQKTLAQTLARKTQNDPDLALIVERWSHLPDALRAGIVAMIVAAG